MSDTATIEIFILLFSFIETIGPVLYFKQACLGALKVIYLGGKIDWTYFTFR